MKKIVYCLLITCILAGCGKNDSSKEAFSKIAAINEAVYAIKDNQLVKYNGNDWDRINDYKDIIDIQAGDELSLVTKDGKIEYTGELELDEDMPNGSAFEYEVAKAAIEFSNTTPLKGIGDDVASTNLLLLDCDGNVYCNRDTEFEQIDLKGKKAKQIDGKYILLEDSTLLSYDWEEKSINEESYTDTVEYIHQGFGYCIYIDSDKKVHVEGDLDSESEQEIQNLDNILCVDSSYGNIYLMDDKENLVKY